MQRSVSGHPTGLSAGSGSLAVVRDDTTEQLRPRSGRLQGRAPPQAGIPATKSARRIASCGLQQNLGGGDRATALADELDARVEIGLARREPLGEREREPSLDQHVQAPAFDLGLLVLAPHGCLDRLGHGARSFVLPLTFPTARSLWRPLRRTREMTRRASVISSLSLRRG